MRLENMFELINYFKNRVSTHKSSVFAVLKIHVVYILSVLVQSYEKYFVFLWMSCMFGSVYVCFAHLVCMYISLTYECMKHVWLSCCECDSKKRLFYQIFHLCIYLFTSASSLSLFFIVYWKEIYIHISVWRCIIVICHLQSIYVKIDSIHFIN